ncbi:MAG: hypothetical protein GY716_25780 [bacterium]|nr:hypothetical protein [bacterium]
MKNTLCIFTALLLASATVAQESTSYELTESSFNAGGAPMGGVSPTSSSYAMTPASIGEGLAGMVLASASFQMQGNFVSRMVAAERAQVVLVAPRDDALAIPIGSNVTLLFTEEIDPASITSLSLRLLDPGGTPVAVVAGLTPDGRTVTIDPTLSLSTSTTYTVDVTDSVTDLFGVPVIPFTSRFRTVDFTDPILISDVSGQGYLPPSPPAQPAPPFAPAGGGGSAAGSEDTFDNLGVSSSVAGDLNGDTLQDLLGGAPGYDALEVVGAGAVAVFLGHENDDERRKPDIIYLGEQPHDRAGVSVAGGFDFNGDNLPDIAIGAEQIDRTGASPADVSAGKVYVIFFNPANYTLGDSMTDFVKLGRVGNPSHTEGEIPGIVFDGVAVGDRAGFAVAAGKSLDGGGGDGVVIGAPGANGENGSAYVIFGNPSLSGRDKDLGTVGGAMLGVRFDGATDEQLGFSLALPGDIFGSAGEELVIGAPSELPTEAGKAYVVEGGGLTNGTTPSYAVQFNGEQAGEKFGFAVAGGGNNRSYPPDLPGDAPDLLIGAPGYDTQPSAPCSSCPDAGRAIHTSGRLTTSPINASQVGAAVNGINGVIWRGVQSNSNLGWSVSNLGDVTGNTLDDIGIGAPNYDNSGDENVGGIYVVQAEAVSLDAADDLGGINDIGFVGITISGYLYVGDDEDEQAGLALTAAGSIDNNEYNAQDFAVGSPGQDRCTAGFFEECNTETTCGEGTCGTDAGILHQVTDSVPDCDDKGCRVAHLATGAELEVPPDAIPRGDNHAFLALGLTDSDACGRFSSPGKSAVGVAEFSKADCDPAPATCNSDVFDDGATVEVEIPTDADAEPFLVVDVDALEVMYCGATGMWTPLPTAATGTVRDNEYVSGRKVVDVDLIDVVAGLFTYGALIDDMDNDLVPDDRDNCIDIANPDQLDSDGDGIGDGNGNPLTPDCDNCPMEFNPSQYDPDTDGIGQACDGGTIEKTVGGSNPDYFTLEAAMAAEGSGTRFVIRPGTWGPTIVDFDAAFIFTGEGSGTVFDGGATGIAIDVRSTANTGVPRFENLIVRGQTGIKAIVSTSTADVEFQNITGVAMNLDGGTHHVDRVTMTNGVANGIDLAAGAELELERSVLSTPGGTGLSIDGTAGVVNTLIYEAKDGIVLGNAGAVLGLSYSTVADCTEKGVDNATGVSTIASSILWGSPINLAQCTAVSWTDIEASPCGGGNGNLSMDPKFADVASDDYRLMSDSPALDQGPDPAGYDGIPCKDLDGDLRLRDHDGDGQAQADMGPYEREDPALMPGEIDNVRWPDKGTLQWDAETGANRYRIYRGDTSSLGFDYFGECQDDGTVTATSFAVTASPASQTAWFFFVTAAESGTAEGTLGAGTCAERTNFAACAP